jgi:hypothetical protein
MSSATRRRLPSDIEQFDADDMPSEMLADDEEVAEELLEEELGDEDDEGIIGECVLTFLYCFFPNSIPIYDGLARSNLRSEHSRSCFQQKISRIRLSIWARDLASSFFRLHPSYAHVYFFDMELSRRSSKTSAKDGD